MAQHDARMEGPHRRPRDLGDRRARDRDRRPARHRRRRRARSPQGRGAGRRDAGVRRHERRGARRVRRLRGREGRVHLDGLRDVRRRAEPHLPVPGPLRRDRARVRPRDRTHLGDCRRGGLHDLRRRGDASAPRHVPVLRGARPLDRGVREPQAGLVGRNDRDRADRRLRRRARRRRRPQAAPPPLAGLHGGRGERRRRRRCLGADGAGLRRCGRASLLAVHRHQLSAAVRLGREGDRRRIGRRPRAADPHDAHRPLADGVLQPVDPKDLVARRQRRQRRRPDPDPRPRRRRRNAHTEPGHAIRARRERRQAAGACRRCDARTTCSTESMASR